MSYVLPSSITEELFPDISTHVNRNVQNLHYKLTDEEENQMCKAFALFDLDGDGVINIPELECMLIGLGRNPTDDELAKVLDYTKSKGCEGNPGMSYNHFNYYVVSQLCDTNNEEELRKAFQVFDTSPPTGKVNVKLLRHHLKNSGLKLSDDEIDFLFKEEDCHWLEERDMEEYEKLICKILDKPCNSKFLGC